MTSPRGTRIEAGERFYLPQLDGLRFCAFLAVFLHHSPLFPGGGRAASFVKQMGWAGVDLFFVLSAYLLITLLRREHAATGGTDLRQFFIRRALRIWPLFFFYIAACFVYYIVTDGTRLAAVAGRTAGHLFFVDNVFTALSDEYNPLNFTPHLWTIAFEEQIYVLLPLLFMGLLFLQRDRRSLVIAGSILVASQPVLRLALASFYTRERAVWVLPLVHFDAVLAGLILGSGIVSGARKVSGDLLVLGAALIFSVMLLVPAGNDFSMFFPDRNAFAFTFLAVAFFLLVLGCLDERSWTARLLALAPFVFLGRISYGLYVWHWAANHFSPALSPDWLSTAANGGGATAWGVTVARALLVTVALSIVSFFLLERPFLRMKQRFTVVPSRVD